MSVGVRIVVEDDGRVTVQNDAGIKREQKGKSLLLATRDFVAIDVETTGLSPMFDDIIELAAVRYADGVQAETYEQLVNPGYEIDAFISALTGITNDMLKDAPALDSVLPEYIKFLGESALVGHNVNFDINFLYDACVDLNLPPLKNDFIDTMRISRRMYKDWPNHRLDTLISELDLPARYEHRAARDAIIAGEAYLKMSASDSFVDAMEPTAKSYNSMAKSIVAKEGYSNESSPLYGKVCVFTGALESFTRRDAMQLVVDIGGICGDGVTKKTNYLILGNNDYCKAIKDGKSSKQKKAEKLILEGADLKIIPESVFLELIDAE